MFPFTQIGNWIRSRALARLQREQCAINEELLMEFRKWLFSHPQNWQNIPGDSTLRVVRTEEMVLPETIEGSNTFVYVLNFYDIGRITLTRRDGSDHTIRWDDIAFTDWLKLTPPLILEATLFKYMEAHESTTQG
ncbi:MAG TPA: hypothetical protein VLF59_00100 [Candidatus Saccharimonadales bacterium]|nr:hypothetical protein [Candidatus Saccharimonadales bacterium]